MIPLPVQLATTLQRSSGRALDHTAKSFLQARFGYDFRDVRIHTDRHAGKTVASCGARALTLGSHVLFGADQYHPENENGLRLLAHELVHVIQQTRANPAEERAPSALPSRIGSPFDPLEREADVVASAVLSGAAVPAIAPDPGGLLRRAVQIQAGTAGIDVIAGMARPSLATNLGPQSDRAVANLSNGFNADPTQVRTAFQFLGHVKVSNAAGNALNGYSFGFLQFIRHAYMGIFYAGRKRSEGSISILVHPALGSSLYVDLFSRATCPFMLPPKADLQGGEATTEMGDHPVWSFSQQMHNFKTGFDNYLFHVRDSRDAYSIFSVRDPHGAYQHLAHVHWSLSYDFKCKWAAGQLMVASNSSSFSVDPAVRGAPTDPAVRGLLGSLGPSMSPIANEAASQALKASLLSPNPNRSDCDGWFSNVPAEFYK